MALSASDSECLAMSSLPQLSSVVAVERAPTTARSSLSVPPCRIPMEVPPQWQALDESMRCKLCTDYLQAAVSIADRGCGHSFCSECIRNVFRSQLKGTNRTMHCPLCRFAITGTIEKTLVRNRALQETVIAYTESLPRLLQSTQPSQPEETAASPNTQSLRRSSRSASKRPRLLVEEEEVMLVPPTPQPTNTLSRRALPNYASKNKKTMQEWCRKEGLPTHGSLEDLKDRHAKFLTLWNSEVDSIQPRPPAQLVQVTVERERQRLSEQGTGQSDQIHMRNLLQNQGTTSGNAKFDQRFASGFHNLIQQARARIRKKPPAPATTCTSDPSESDTALTTSTQSPITTASTTTSNGTETTVTTSNSTATTTSPTLSITRQNGGVSHPSLDTATESPPTDVNLAENGASTQSSNVQNVEDLSIHPPNRPKRPAEEGMEEQPRRLSPTTTLLPTFSSTSFSSLQSHSSVRQSATALPRPTVQPLRAATMRTKAWGCPRCTYFNEASHWKNPKCRMCGLDKNKQAQTT